MGNSHGATGWGNARSIVAARYASTTWSLVVRRPPCSEAVEPDSLERPSERGFRFTSTVSFLAMTGFAWPPSAFCSCPCLSYCLGRPFWHPFVWKVTRASRQSAIVAARLRHVQSALFLSVPPGAKSGGQSRRMQPRDSLHHLPGCRTIPTTRAPALPAASNRRYLTGPQNAGLTNRMPGHRGSRRRHASNASARKRGERDCRWFGHRRKNDSKKDIVRAGGG